MKNAKSFLWNREPYKGKIVDSLRVRIWEKSKSDRIEIYSGQVLEHDGKIIGNSKISEFSYIITSTGIKKMFDAVHYQYRLYVYINIYINIYITLDFDRNVLDTFDYPEIKYIKEALKEYDKEKLY